MDENSPSEVAQLEESVSTHTSTFFVCEHIQSLLIYSEPNQARALSQMAELLKVQCLLLYAPFLEKF